MQQVLANLLMQSELLQCFLATNDFRLLVFVIDRDADSKRHCNSCDEDEDTDDANEVTERHVLATASVAVGATRRELKPEKALLPTTKDTLLTAGRKRLVARESALEEVRPDEVEETGRHGAFREELFQLDLDVHRVDVDGNHFVRRQLLDETAEVDELILHRVVKTALLHTFRVLDLANYERPAEGCVQLDAVVGRANGAVVDPAVEDERTEEEKPELDAEDERVHEINPLVLLDVRQAVSGEVC